MRYFEEREISEEREREKEKEKSWFSETAEHFSSDAAVGKSEDLVVRAREQEIGIDPDLQMCDRLLTEEKFNDFFEFLDEMKELNVPLSKEVYSSVICAYIKQGNLAEAEKTFAMMKATGCMPDVITYTSMINAYRITDDWKKAWDVFVEMRVNNIKPDPIACSALMEALNRGCQSAMVLQLNYEFTSNLLSYSSKGNQDDQT
ncbi:hypothetical protein KFK09_026781 [Dendrobium nobile]|uniref:Pentatricopeptide repeat-containing protein n=1 Tax=Dendrobium nobile TaxID=94219 RepID=A0A8T3A8P6_DENNO|nr:hypothetical protein KFK09_026781 [Dendrobium nobile]